MFQIHVKDQLLPFSVMLAELEFQQIVANGTSNLQDEYLKKISKEIMDVET